MIIFSPPRKPAPDFSRVRENSFFRSKRPYIYNRTKYHSKCSANLRREFPGGKQEDFCGNGENSQEKYSEKKRGHLAPLPLYGSTRILKFLRLFSGYALF